MLLGAVVAALFLSSCYAPMTPPMRKQSYKDSLLTVYEKYPDGSYKSRKDIEFKSQRKRVIEEKRFMKGPSIYVFGGPVSTASSDSSATPAPEIDTLSAGDSTAVDSSMVDLPDSLMEAEIIDKQFYIDDNIYIQREKYRGYASGTTVLKEKTRKRSKFRDGCEIVTYKRTKVYNDRGDVIFKENFNPFYWRQVRIIYDESGKKLESRVLKFMFKPKFRNYP